MLWNDEDKNQKNMKDEDYKGVYYSEYLQLDKILNAQQTESGKLGNEVHDEMLFVIIHQSYELWFKQILHEVSSVMAIFKQTKIDDSSADLAKAVHRLKRVNTILTNLVNQVDIIETLTPLDFLDFRDLLRPASGFQSMQFKILEATLGLKMPERHGKQYYTSALKDSDKALIEEMEKQPKFIDLINEWLERMPFWEAGKFWTNYERKFDHQIEIGVHDFWQDYLCAYDASLGENEKENLKKMVSVCFRDIDENTNRLSAKASRNALFIMLYRDYPLLQAPFQVLQSLLDIDETMSLWRFRHINMVHRMIGGRVGTGGSSGKEYLQNALNSHYIFKEIADLTSFLLERRNLPNVCPQLEKALRFG